MDPHSADSDRALVQRLRACPTRSNRDSVALLCAEARQLVREARQSPDFRAMLLLGARRNAARVAELRAEIRQAARRRPARSRFDERDCSGVYDGFGVFSDADPGL